MGHNRWISKLAIMLISVTSVSFTTSGWARAPGPSGSLRIHHRTVPQRSADYKLRPCYFERYSRGVTNIWKPRSWKHLTPELIDHPDTRTFRVSAGHHPRCSREPELCETALSTSWLDLDVSVFIDGSKEWSSFRQLAPYFILTRNYFRQARINLIFKCGTLPTNVTKHPQSPLKVIFGEAILNPKGRLVDGFGNLELGQAVINDQIMKRPRRHSDPHFLPGKPIGHEIGHVLGLAHVEDKRYLMAQGTSAKNKLRILPKQAVIMRSVALSLFDARVGKAPRR